MPESPQKPKPYPTMGSPSRNRIRAGEPLSKRKPPKTAAEQIAALETAGMLQKALGASGAATGAISGGTEPKPDRFAGAMAFSAVQTHEKPGNKRAGSEFTPSLGALPLEEEAYALKCQGYLPYEIASHLTQTRTAREGRVLSETEVEGLITTVSSRRQRSTQASMSEMFQIELDRIERLIKALWDTAEDGNVAAMDRVLKLMQKKHDLLGMDAPEIRASFVLNAGDLDYSRLSTDQLRQLKDLMALAGLGPRQEKTVGQMLVGGVVEKL